MQTRAVPLLACLLLVSACSPSSPVTPGCSSSTDCHGGLECVDGRCVAGTDAGRTIDGGHDAASLDAPRSIDANLDANCLPVGCAATETCFNGVDDDCNGVVDDTCACVPGTTARCLPGRFDPAVPLCSWGAMTCTGAGELGTWSACSGGGTRDGGSSPYGCRRIGILGAPGSNPSSNFQAWLEMQGAIVTRFHDTATAPTLRREELEVFDLVIVDYVQRAYTPAESTTLADWVTAGGGLFVMTGHSGAVGTVHNTLLVSLGPSYDVAHGLLNGPATLLPSSITGDGAGGTLPPVTFAGGFAVVVPATLPSLVPFATIGSDVVGVVGPFGAGQLVVFGDEWIEFDSEWSTMPPIVRLWTNSVRDLAPDAPLIVACPDR